MFDQTNALRSENLQLSLQNERLRLEGTGLSGGTGLGVSALPGDARTVERIQALEQKLLSQQEELTELHRRKGENAQQIIDLNSKLQEKERLLTTKEIRYVS